MYKRSLTALQCLTLQCLTATLLLAGAPVLATAESAASPEDIDPQHKQLVDSMKIRELEVYPAEVQLDGPFQYRQMVVSGVSEAGKKVDLTHLVQWHYQPDAIRLSARKRIQAVADGSSELRVQYGDLTASVRVTCQNTLAKYQPSFKQDVQPVLSKLGCNAGTCHGSKDGKNGFKLSLRGYDPVYDYRSLTDDLAARRFNRAAPDQSLFLLKSTGAVPHAGGALVDPASDHYAILRAWISQGARFDEAPVPRVQSIEVFPQDPIIPLPGMTQQVAVIASYTDGTRRDVSREAFVESGNIEVAEADGHGQLKLLRRGEAAALVRYEGAYVATTLTVMGDRSGFQWQQPPTFNYVDEHVYAKLQRVKVSPADLCTDAEFARRLYLDLTGLPPSVSQLREFLADPADSKAKRDALVDRLVGSPEFVEYWTNKWADLLQVNRKFLGEQGAAALRNWIRQSVSENKPYDQFVTEIITASGSNIDVPPAAYYKTLRTPEDLMENTTHLFLAIRFNCNKCHDHPFERWTQDQYYELAAYFAQVDRKRDVSFGNQNIGGSAVEGATPLVEVVYDKAAGELKHERTGEIAAPQFPYVHDATPARELGRRQQLALWLTSRENPYFARSMVNRLWGYLFGVGIIDPIDDIRAGNPPSNPELLDALEKDFLAHGFDLQHMLATICKSRTYQHSIQSNRWNVDDKVNFSHFIPRRLPAETLYDSIHFALGAPLNIPGVPAGIRAAELPDSGVAVPFLEDFGRPVRESACECERSNGVVLGPVMKLINGPTISDALMSPKSELNQLIENNADDRQVIEEIFLRLLAREPTPAEIEASLAAIASVGENHHSSVQQLLDYENTLLEKQPAWEKQFAAGTLWQPLAPTESKSAAGAQFEVLDDLSLRVTGPLTQDTYELVFETDLEQLTGIRLEALPDNNLKAGGPGRADNGNFVVNELQLFQLADDGSQPTALTLGQATADFSQGGWPVANAIDANLSTGWAIMPSFGKPHTATFTLNPILPNSKPAAADEHKPLKIKLVIRHEFQDGKHNLGRFRISLTQSPDPSSANEIPADIAQILAVDADQRQPEQTAQLREYYLAADAQYRVLKQAVARGEQEIADRRKVGLQDVAWALINNPSFLFNR